MTTRELLERVPAVYAQLGDALHVQRGTTTADRVSGGGNSRPLVLEPDVAEHRHLLLRGLRYWAATIQQQGHTPRRVGGSVPHLCAGIIHGLHHLTTEQLAELDTNLSEWIRGAGKVANPVRLRSIVPLGAATCPNRTEVEDAEVWACAGQLRLMVPEDRRKTPWLACQSCRTTYRAAELPQALDVSLPLSAVAELTGIPVRTLQHRVQRGKLESEGGNVRLGDALRADTAQCAPGVAQ